MRLRCFRPVSDFIVHLFHTAVLSDPAIPVCLITIHRPTQAKEPELPTAPNPAAANPVDPQESVERSIQGSVDLGYSLVAGSNTFMGLQDVNTPSNACLQLAD